MKVKAICGYYDLHFNRDVRAGEILEVTEDRAEVLIFAKVAQAVTTPTTEKVAKAKTKKGDK